MGKLSQVNIGAPPTTKVLVLLAGGTAPIEVGLRLLPVAERSQANRAAQLRAEKAGAPKWDRDDPVCALELYVEIVARAAFDVDDPQRREPWASADELRESAAIGQENLAYLYEAYEAFESEHCLRLEGRSSHEFTDVVLKLASGDESPLDRLRLSTLRTWLRTLAAQYVSLLHATSQNSLASASPH